MDVMRTGTSMLGNLEPEGDFSNQLDSINREALCHPLLPIGISSHMMDKTSI